MDRSLLHRYTRQGDEAEPEDAGAVDDLVCFGWQRGRERSVMLELRKKNGNRLAVGYSWIERMEFDPSTGILLVAGLLQIQVRGRNLNVEARSSVRLFEGLTRHRVSWIQEASLSGLPEPSEPSCLVTLIDW